MSYLAVESVCKTFGGFKALDNVTLHAEEGTILAVLGENGAGKTTLMNVLYGLYRPDEGQIYIDGQPVILSSPRDAIRHRIGMIHQHFHLVNALTVTENILIGLAQPLSRLTLDDHKAKIRAMSEQFGFEVDLDAPVWKLPLGMQQRVEILKALYRNARVLVLDEPTSVLTPDEITSLLSSLRKLRDTGATILFVTHKLDEVFSTADHVAVMRHGRVVMKTRARDTTPQQLCQSMIGRDVSPPVLAREASPGGPLLEVQDICARNARGALALQRVSFTLRTGEILGVTGVDGNGQTELAEVIAGLRVSESGTVRVAGDDVTDASIAARTHRHKIGFVPEDRHTTGLVLGHSVWINFFLRNFYTQDISPAHILRHRTMRDKGNALARKFDCRLHSIDQPVSQLSGGNQQKVILAREVEAEPKLLIVMQPTKGLDLGAIEFVQRMLIKQRDAGMAILYISTELEHVLEVADRVAVMYRGKITGELARKHVTADRIGMLMSGMALEAVQ